MSAKLSTVVKILKSYIKGSFPLIQINSSEHERVFELLIDFYVRELSTLGNYNWNLYFYDSADGLQTISGTEKLVFENIPGTTELESAFLSFLNRKGYSIFVMKNLHLFLEDIYRKPRIIDFLFKIFLKGIKEHFYFINIGEASIPEELKSYFVTIDIPLPDEDTIKSILDEYITQEEDKKKIKEATYLCKGMTCAEIQNNVVFSLVHTGKLDLALLKEEKARAVKKTGLLEWVEDIPSIKEVGGLENLKEWFLKVGNVFLNYEKAKAYGIQVPKGCLLIGVPGTGKTLCAKAIASLFKVPLFRLDISRLYSSLVGETERNVRSVIKQIDAMSPCIVLIDELEKAFAGYYSSSYTDSGVTARVLGSFLYYFQEKKSLAYFVCTANDISSLPPEMLRKGRFDEIWYLSLPTTKERYEIWRIHLEKAKKKVPFDWIKQLAARTKGFTGAEIESVIQETLYHTFFEAREPVLEDFFAVIRNTVPLSRREANRIRKLEEWAIRSNIRFASKVEREEVQEVETKVHRKLM